MSIRYAFAGDRDLSVIILQFLISENEKPLALLLPNEEKASHSKELKKLCPFLEKEAIIVGQDYKKYSTTDLLKKLDLDYILGIHYPNIIPKILLDIPKYGFLNLHPAYLPFNRGWHTPSWAILDNTPYGATLHVMSEQLDCGDIIFQKKIEVLPNDTADSLYKRVKLLEIEVFKEAWPILMSKTLPKNSQTPDKGTVHKKTDLEKMQQINLSERVEAGKLIDKIRALTTNNPNESAFFEKDGKRYRIRAEISEVK